MRISIRVLSAALVVSSCQSDPQSTESTADITVPPILLPTGAFITPTAAPGSSFHLLNPDLPTRPDYVVGQAVTTALSPDRNTLLVLTSGYNRNYAASEGHQIDAESNEYVFVFDVSSNPPMKRQVIQVPNTFDGIVWHPDGHAFYVSGGKDDNVHTYQRSGGVWAESGEPIPLGHTAGLGLGVGPQAAGVAINGRGDRLVVANFENDSISIVNLATRGVSELPLRPGGGVAGGEFPFWVQIAGNKAYVSSERDHEIVVVDLDALRVSRRISVGGQPNRMLLNADQTRLFVANGNGDTVSVIDTARDRVIETFATLAPRDRFRNRAGLHGANPNSLALSPDERTLYVTNGGINAVAVIRLGDDDGDDDDRSEVVGLIPTGWYPDSVTVSGDGSRLYVTNGKSVPGPDPGSCRDTLSTAPGAGGPCTGRNQYVLQLEKAGFLTLPVPSRWTLGRLTDQVAENNHFPGTEDTQRDERMMAFLRSHIHHVIYIIKENRTYDQILGDLEVGDGDPDLTLFPEPLTPNFHALARNFVALDRFFDSGEVSGVGWNWSTGARTTDIIEKTQFLNYAGRGLSYDWEGTNRNINVGLPTLAERLAAFPGTPTDPDLLPGAIDVAAPQAPGAVPVAEYLWDAALRAGLSVRNYGCYGDLVRYSVPASNPLFIPLLHDPFTAGVRQFFPTKQSLLDITDPYFRGYDQKFPDYWREKEWEREFDGYVAARNLPALELVRLPHDHFGSFASAIDGVNTPDRQMADNDYAVALLIDKVSHSPYAGDTLVFVIEDDAQDGPDHVDAHRSTGFVVGPYVKQGEVISEAYTTVSMVRTIEDVLGIGPLGLTDGLAAPMTEVFERRAHDWRYDAIVPDVLHSTSLPVAVVSARRHQRSTGEAGDWERAMAGQNFDREDAVDAVEFNHALWRGIKAGVPYPTERHGRDLSHDRAQLLSH
jgi:YVTN family beta-propeller protein